MPKFVIYWKCNKAMKANIVREFGFPDYTSLNGETEVTVTKEQYSRLLKGQEMGLFEIRNKCKEE